MNALLTFPFSINKNIMAKEYLKAVVTTVMRCLLRIYYLIPLKKRIVFEAFNGKQITCNPYYIYCYMQKQYPDYEYIWCYNKKEEKSVHCIPRNSLAYIYYLLTSAVYITNDTIPQYIPFRKKQMVINTWHGGGSYKRVGTELGEKCNWYNRLNLKRTSKSTSYFLSSSEVFTEAAPKSFLIPSEKILPIGMPRNDIFFNQQQMEEANRKVRSLYNIPNGSFIVLYAPTFRTTNDNLQPNFLSMVNAIKERFNPTKVYVFIRAHHLMNISDENLPKDLCINVSSYPYMQELLATANMLISDYSSCIWDYSFTYRPCFLYVPDLSQYKSDRDFHKPIETWGFPIAQTNKELINIIRTFDYSLFKQAMTKHQNTLKSYEKGTATIAVCNLILRQLKS